MFGNFIICRRRRFCWDLARQGEVICLTMGRVVVLIVAVIGAQLVYPSTYCCFLHDLSILQYHDSQGTRHLGPRRIPLNVFRAPLWSQKHYQGKKTNQKQHKSSETGKHLCSYYRIRPTVSVRWTPHPVIVTIMEHGNCIWVLLYSC